MQAVMERPNGVSSPTQDWRPVAEPEFAEVVPDDLPSSYEETSADREALWAELARLPGRAAQCWFCASTKDSAITRPRFPRDPQDLRGVFREHEGPAVDVAGLMSGVRHRIDRRHQRRRTAGIVAVGIVTALAAGVPIFVSSIPEQDSGIAGGTSQPAPTATASAPAAGEALDRDALGSTEFAFSVAEPPGDYTMESLSTGPGWQLLRLYTLDNVDAPRTLDVGLYDLGLAGLAAPEPTGETVEIESSSAGPLTVQVISLSQEGQSYPGVGWLTGNGLLLTVTSDGPADLARPETLAVAAQVDLEHPYPLTFPFQGAVANTTVGQYEATITGDGYLTIYYVDGFLIDISVRPDFVDRIDDEQLRQIGVRILVIPERDRRQCLDRPAARLRWRSGRSATISSVVRTTHPALSALESH